MWEIILKVKPKQLSRLLFSRDLERSAKVIVGLVVVAIFFAGSYWMFHRVFSYLITVQDIGILLIDRIISIAFLAFLIMLTMSNLIGAIGALYRSPETTFLMASPIPFRHVFWVRYSDNMFYSSWATLVLTIPAILAYGIVHQFTLPYFLVVALVALPCFILIPAAVGSGLSMIVFPVAKKFGSRRILLIMGVLAVIGTFFFIRARFSRIVFTAQGDLALLNYYLQDLATNEGQWLPSAWFAEIMRAARLNRGGDLIFYVSMLLSTLGGFVILLDIVAQRLYYPAFLAASEILGRKRRNNRTSHFYGITWKLFTIFPRDMRALLVKDIRLFLREPNQWTQFAILLVLIIFYLINLRKVPSNVEGLYWQILISFANYAFCGYILATLSVRFVYPSISMEGKSFWSIASSPVKMKRLFWEKFWIAFIIFFIITEIVAVVSSALLAQSQVMTLLTSIGIFLMSISLTSIATGLGSLFPSFSEPNPGKIASSGGGMICALVSLIYVALSTLALAFPTYSYLSYIMGQRVAFPTTELIIGGAILLAVNIIATIIPLKLGLRAIENLEF
ncbi:MAG TPA: hypothetical protein ENN07_00080 [candidate division Zixibacteria bacterium]|nr:hypothetical protein [candidate division Zixibacteria bacterium]